MSCKIQLVRKTFATFVTDEGGMVTHLALVVLMIVLLFSGIAVDSTNAWRVKYILQTAADAAAHAAIMKLPDENAALDAALELANDNLAPISSQSAITQDAVEFGNWNPDLRVFSTEETPINSVKVTATRSSANTVPNPLPTFFLRFSGFKNWDIQVKSVAYLSSQKCSSADISSNGIVAFNSENDFYNGFCVQAAQGLTLDTHNQFDDDNLLSVANTADVSFSGSESLSTNVGRGTSASSASLVYSDVIATKAGISAPYTVDVAALAASYLDPYSNIQPSYINANSAVIQVNANDVKYTSFAPGRIYNVQCGETSGDTAQFFHGATLSEVVIISNCAINIGAESVLKDVVLISKASGNDSVYISEKVQLGAKDECASGGGVSIYSAGSTNSESNIEVNGVYISSVGTVDINADSDAIAGIAIDAGGNVTFDHTAQFGTCKDTSAISGKVSYLLVQ